MDHAHLEALAIETYERHGFDPAEPVSSLRIARKWLGPDAIARPPSLLGVYPATTYTVAGNERIGVRRTVPDDELRFYVAHELAHKILGFPHGAVAELEDACDILAACIVGPRPAARALYRAYGWTLSKVAGCLASTQTLAALRIGETENVPLATVGPIRVRVRGPETFVWGTEEQVRALARAPKPGVRKVRVTDRTKRAVLVAEG